MEVLNNIGTRYTYKFFILYLLYNYVSDYNYLHE